MQSIPWRRSAKLFADAALEESAPPSPRVTLLENQHKNWDGDESVEDAVLRMLVDTHKHKPLRTGAI
ncbi:hypothetical protein FIBSPDRAFT_953579 [Athelia psychrophila]|uniref:Uncharacterized protein n=1 Tax=Athelia psychrophila TaxID=1759441 RepID=A0A166K5U8_9AGAM|nr:hypothetical protein FIBSPDRAFT_953579 [Fibularhizoctonia sp. CBS 109695]